MKVQARVHFAYCSNAARAELSRKYSTADIAEHRTCCQEVLASHLSRSSPLGGDGRPCPCRGRHHPPSHHVVRIRHGEVGRCREEGAPSPSTSY